MEGISICYLTPLKPDDRYRKGRRTVSEPQKSYTFKLPSSLCGVTQSTLKLHRMLLRFIINY